ncbi:MAG: N-(5'-phosphoribosyl)anthranilate isomerase [Roseovarius sp.]|nr:N-(5'-phosphoribosyl)anthranilate isomerase [Roseovarius sp.]
MNVLTRLSPPEPWIAQLFGTKSARKGAVVRRSCAWVEREVGRERFFQEIEKRGFHLIETADQFLVICHNGPIRFVF